MVFAASTVQSTGSVTADAERSVAGSSRGSSHAITQFDFPEPVTEESSVEITAADIPVKVYIIM